jgi:hypothetical protein
MPQLIHNDDGSRTLKVNSTELRTLLDGRVPGFGKAVRVLKEPDVRTVLEFLRAVVS